jgi:hypothetical protein
VVAMLVIVSAFEPFVRVKFAELEEPTATDPKF